MLLREDDDSFTDEAHTLNQDVGDHRENDD